MWVAVLYVFANWNGALMDTVPMFEFPSYEDCYEFVNTQQNFYNKMGCFKKENAPKEWHRR
jgi:hypothetical protein